MNQYVVENGFPDAGQPSGEDAKDNHVESLMISIASLGIETVHQSAPIILSK
jgi:hypothetical protein